MYTATTEIYTSCHTLSRHAALPIHPMNRQAPISPAQREEAGLLDVLPLAATGQAGESACDVAFPPPLARDWATALATGVDADNLMFAALAIAEARLTEIGRAPGRERGCQYVLSSVVAADYKT